jgi:hypothetical protein
VEHSIVRTKTAADIEYYITSFNEDNSLLGSHACSILWFPFIFDHTRDFPHDMLSEPFEKFLS